MDKETNLQYERFDRTMRTLIKVPHDVLKAKLDAERRAKAKKRKAKKPSVSRDSGGASRDSDG